VLFDSRTRQATPASGTRAGYDGAKRRRGSKGHTAVDPLGHLVAVHGTAANAQNRHQVAEWAQQVQHVLGEAREIADVDQGDTGAQAVQDAQAHPMPPDGVKLPEAKRVLSCCPNAG
jgi:hypothetical protein